MIFDLLIESYNTRVQKMLAAGRSMLAAGPLKEDIGQAAVCKQILIIK